uniref:Uncharacterized protein n=1 Tax=Fundulus heteroclitus TaxID=8078 RepID=A0A3Q2NVE7_FUNHE
AKQKKKKKDRGRAVDERCRRESAVSLSSASLLLLLQPDGRRRNRFDKANDDGRVFLLTCSSCASAALLLWGLPSPAAAPLVPLPAPCHLHGVLCSPRFLKCSSLQLNVWHP